MKPEDPLPARLPDHQAHRLNLDPFAPTIRNRWKVIFISLGLFALACCLPSLVFSAGSKEETRIGITAFLMGPLGFLMGMPAWLANPLLLWSMIAIRKGYWKKSIVLGLFAIGFAMTTSRLMTRDPFPLSDAGGMYNLKSLDIGYFVRIASMIVMVIGSTVFWRKSLGAQSQLMSWSTIRDLIDEQQPQNATIKACILLFAMACLTPISGSMLGAEFMVIGVFPSIHLLISVLTGNLFNAMGSGIGAILWSITNPLLLVSIVTFRKKYWKTTIALNLLTIYCALSPLWAWSGKLPWAGLGAIHSGNQFGIGYFFWIASLATIGIGAVFCWRKSLYRSADKP